MLPNASYYAFTATPKNKTLEIFGDPVPGDGETKHRPFHSYTMKQAIEEGFILDVLKNYMPVNSYYKLVKTVEADPEFDVRRASKKLRHYVESNDHAIRLKAEIMVDHFHDQVLGLKKIGGQARAMVVTGSVERAIQYFFAISEYLIERKSPYRAIVAFSGTPEFKGQVVSEASLNEFPEQGDRRQDSRRPVSDPCLCRQVSDRLRRAAAPHHVRRQATCWSQSGSDAVSAQSCAPAEARLCVLDFMNNTDVIEQAFAPYYRTTILGRRDGPQQAARS